jgi:hypothetical protein
MRFQQERVVDPYGTFLGFDANGSPCYQETVLQAEHSDFFAGDGTLGPDYFVLPVPAFNIGSLVTDCVFVQDAPGADQIFIGISIIGFGAAGLTTVSASIEFQDPDNPALWIASREMHKSGAGGLDYPFRNMAPANMVWNLTNVGNFLIASRVEHKHFTKFRLRLRGNAAVDGDTDIRCYWYAGVHRSPW